MAEASGINVEDMLTDLKRYLTEIMVEDSFVVALYLFGSSVRDEAEERSDLDLAFLLDHEVYSSDPLTAASPAYILATRVGMRFKKETDVTILNASSLEMAYEVVTSGRCIYEVTLEKRLEYEAKVRGMYYDFRPFLMEMRTRCLDGI